MSKTFTRDVHVKLEAEMLKLLAPLAKKHGLILTGAGGSIGRLESVFKIRAVLPGDGGSVYGPEEAAWKDSAKLIGLKPNLLGKTVMTTTQGAVKILGLQFSSGSRRRHFPVLAQRAAGGKNVLLTVDTVKNATLVK